MRLCKFCLQDNLVSDTVLEERYCIRVFMPAPIRQDGKCFSKVVAGRVWYFRETCGPKQRSEYSADCLDTHQMLGKAARLTWFFWRPHLEQVLDMPQILEDAGHKHAAAHIIRAQVRRALTLRALGPKSTCTARERTKQPTYKVVWTGRSQAIRTAVFTLRQMTGVTTPQTFTRSLPRWNNKCLNRISACEDMVN